MFPTNHRGPGVFTTIGDSELKPGEEILVETTNDLQQPQTGEEKDSPTSG